MSHNEDKARQESSLIGKILSMEALIFVMGCVSLWYGFTKDEQGMGIFWGVVILVGFVVLKLVRKKDWAKHFAEMEAEHKAREAARKPAPPTEPPDGKPS